MIINVLYESDCISINNWRREFDSINSLCESLNIILNESNEEDSNNKKSKIKDIIKQIISKIKTMYDNFLSDYAYPFITKCQKDFIETNVDKKKIDDISNSFPGEFTINASKYISYRKFNMFKDKIFHYDENGLTILGIRNDKIYSIPINEIEISDIKSLYDKLASNGEYKISKEALDDAIKTIFDKNKFANIIRDTKLVIINQLNDCGEKNLSSEDLHNINYYIQGALKIYSLYLQTCMKVLKATIKKYGSQNTKED